MCNPFAPRPGLFTSSGLRIACRTVFHPAVALYQTVCGPYAARVVPLGHRTCVTSPIRFMVSTSDPGAILTR